MDPNIRIGDAERDKAIERLRAHHAAGRLDIIEFDDRMELALNARTAGDLIALFKDLPDEPFDDPAAKRRSAFPPAQQPMGVAQYTAPPGPMQSVERKETRPIYAEPGFFWVLFIIVIMTGMRLWPLLVVGAIWLWVIAPMAQRNSIARHEPDRYYFQAGDIQGEIRALLRADRKIEAVKRYREVYGAGLKEAKDAVDYIEQQDRGIGG